MAKYLVYQENLQENNVEEKKGFSKKSSCAPFKNYKTIKSGGPKEEYSFIFKEKLGEGEKEIYQPEI